MIVDVRLAFRFALRVLALLVLLATGVFAGLSIAWIWPLNFAGAVALVGLGYVLGRVHESDLSSRPPPTMIAPALPVARARRRSL